MLSRFLVLMYQSECSIIKMRMHMHGVKKSTVIWYSRFLFRRTVHCIFCSVQRHFASVGNRSRKRPICAGISLACQPRAVSHSLLYFFLPSSFQIEFLRKTTTATRKEKSERETIKYQSSHTTICLTCSFARTQSSTGVRCKGWTTMRCESWRKKSKTSPSITMIVPNGWSFHYPPGSS